MLGVKLMHFRFTLSVLATAAIGTLGIAGTSFAAEREVKISGFGAKSGVVRSFGVKH